MGTELEGLRARFCAHLASKQLFFTLALLSTVQVAEDEELPAMAAINVGNTRKDGTACPLQMSLSPKLVRTAALSDMAKFFIMNHELRHIPQVVNAKALAELLDLSPLGIVKGADDSSMRQQILNICLDAALHEDLTQLYGQPVVDEITQYIQNEGEASLAEGSEAQLDAMNIPGTGVTEARIRAARGLCLVPRFNTFRNMQPIPAQSEFLQIAPNYIEWLATWWKPSYGPSAAGGPTDQHNGFDDAEGEAAQAAARAVEYAQEEAKRLAHQAGQGASDFPMESKGVKLAAQARRLLQKLKITTTRLSQKAKDVRYSYEQPHRLFPELDYIPGRMTQPRPKREAILILDTSGSMFEQTVLDRLVGAAKELEKQDKLHAIYCGDTTYHRTHMDAKVCVTGGGGTSLYPADLLQIKQELGIKGKCDFVYITDEMCLGLEESKQPSKEYTLHVIHESRMG